MEEREDNKSLYWRRYVEAVRNKVCRKQATIWEERLIFIADV